MSFLWLEQMRLREELIVIERVGEFELVSQETLDKFNVTRGDIVLPSRATSGSAGYDIYSPSDVVINPHSTVTIPLGVKVRVDNGWYLQIVPRSSVGIKYHLMLANSTGIIDEDYYDNPDNEGMMFLALHNYGEKPIYIENGDRVAQGIFVQYGITYSDEVDTERTGGIGSTG